MTKPIFKMELIKGERNTPRDQYGGFVEWGRVKVPGGWFVVVPGYQESSAFFYPDKKHEWDGGSLP